MKAVEKTLDNSVCRTSAQKKLPYILLKSFQLL